MSCLKAHLNKHSLDPGSKPADVVFELVSVPLHILKNYGLLLLLPVLETQTGTLREFIKK